MLRVCMRVCVYWFEYVFVWWVCWLLEMEGSGGVIRKLYFSGEFSEKAQQQINNSWNWVKEIIIVFIFL